MHPQADRQETRAACFVVVAAVIVAMVVVVVVVVVVVLDADIQTCSFCFNIQQQREREIKHRLLFRLITSSCTNVYLRINFLYLTTGVRLRSLR